MSNAATIIRQFGDDTAITDPTKAQYNIDIVNLVPQRLNLAVALNGSSQFSIRTDWAGSVGGTGFELTVRTFGAIFKRGITP